MRRRLGGLATRKGQLRDSARCGESASSHRRRSPLAGGGLGAQGDPLCYSAVLWTTT